jgi:medium-chain acyl-[acyl-carrier-protein] hydrolase
MTTMRTASWIIRTKSQPHLRLFCFPYAGGGASIFRLWSEKLPSQVEVCPIYLPGRENRLKEPLFTHLAPLVQTLAHALHPFMDIPFAFFGHSMGALISFELARHLHRIHYPGPAQLFVSAHRAPQLPDTNAPLHDLPDPALVDALSRLGGTPQAILQHTELMNVMLPILRADLTLCETYIYTAEPPLDCPIAVFGGKQDSMVSAQELREWRHQTRSACMLHILPGDHFFLHSQQHLLLATLSRLMSGL